MNTALNRHKLILMRREAERRLADADTLAEADMLTEAIADTDAPEARLCRVSDSAYLLRLLGLELLLKCVHEATLRTVSRHGHHYEVIFSTLPAAMQARHLRLAGERIGPSGLASDALGVLAEWGRNFIALRYPYEKYEHPSEQVYRALGERWVAEGAPLQSATFRYYPEELFGFVHALRIVADEVASGANESPLA